IDDYVLDRAGGFLLAIACGGIARDAPLFERPGIRLGLYVQDSLECPVARWKPTWLSPIRRIVEVVDLPDKSFYVLVSPVLIGVDEVNGVPAAHHTTDSDQGQAGRLSTCDIIRIELAGDADTLDDLQRGDIIGEDIERVLQINAAQQPPIRAHLERG